MNKEDLIIRTKEFVHGYVKSAIYFLDSKNANNKY